jgi:ABC-type transport system involved in multi-copper enzyme maturation permease subunit
MNRVVAIALHTFKESVREKVLYNLVIFALLMIVGGLLLGGVSVGINAIALVNLALSAISVFGLLIAVFIGVSLVSKEMERRTLYNVLSKPVGRAEFIVGKYLGLVLTLLVNTAIMTAGFYLALRLEKGELAAADLAPLEGIYFIILQLTIVVGVALLFSTISGPALAALFTLSLYVIGSLLEDLRTFAEQPGSALLHGLLRGLSLILPDFGAFSDIAPAAHGEFVPGGRILTHSLYALLYSTVLISAAILIFERRDLP